MPKHCSRRYQPKSKRTWSSYDKHENLLQTFSPPPSPPRALPATPMVFQAISDKYPKLTALSFFLGRPLRRRALRLGSRLENSRFTRRRILTGDASKKRVFRSAYVAKMEMSFLTPPRTHTQRSHT